jgi:hypothetical protein
MAKERKPCADCGDLTASKGNQKQEVYREYIERLDFFYASFHSAIQVMDLEKQGHLAGLQGSPSTEIDYEMPFAEKQA